MKSSSCESGGCVEVDTSIPGNVFIRASEDPDRVIVFTRNEWDVFTKGVKAGEFDID